MAKILRAIWLLPSSYIGLNRRLEISPFVIYVVIGPIWETLIFQGILFGIPLSFVRRSWNVVWLPDPEFDRLLKWSIIIISGLISNFIFMTYHRPGHFGTLFVEIRARRLLKKMEAAWLWERFEVAKNYASELLPLAEEWWIREGSDYSRFLQALSLYVLSSGKETAVRHKQKMKIILSEVGIYSNDILRIKTVDEI